MGSFSSFSITAAIFWQFLLVLCGFPRIFHIFLQLWCCLCGWLGRQLVHALGFLFLFGMLCMLDFCRHFCSYFLHVTFWFVP